MSWIAALLLCCILASTTFAQSPRGLEEKVRLLQDMLMKRPVINLNNDRWKSLVKASPRNYSTIVMFTALSSEVSLSSFGLFILF
jgi:oligosaccharyltransferase complex subunit gamma